MLTKSEILAIVQDELKHCEVKEADYTYLTGPWFISIRAEYQSGIVFDKEPDPQYQRDREVYNSEVLSFATDQTEQDVRDKCRRFLERIDVQ